MTIFLLFSLAQDSLLRVSIEAGVVLDVYGAPIYWHSPGHRTTVSLPDSRDLWDVFWKNRQIVSGFAHSHPGTGTPSPSHTDITTFAAVEAGIGRHLSWWILSADEAVLCTWQGPDRHSYNVLRIPSVLSYDNEFAASEIPITRPPSWMARLRRVSEFEKTDSTIVFRVSSRIKNRIETIAADAGVHPDAWIDDVIQNEIAWIGVDRMIEGEKSNDD
jgi:Prokaryotic homologs of the JAB domain